VGYAWIDGLKAHANSEVSDTQLMAAQHRFPFNTPRTKEAYFVRQVFEEHFGQQSARETVVYEPSVACSSATAIAWDESFKATLSSNGEQSGRAVKVHKHAYSDVVASAHGYKQQEKKEEDKEACSLVVQATSS
jgi:asparagine synthase (glutamine-hydrolysing)